MYKKLTRRNLSLRFVLLACTAFWIKPADAQVDVTATAGTTAASYTNLSSAFTAINAGTHQGAITVNISASFTEAGNAILNSSGAGTASYTSVLVQPSADGVVVSFATTTGRGVIELNGADNVTIDGDNPNTAGTNRNLTVTNTAANTITFTSVIRVAAGTVAPYLDNNNIVVRNLNINGSATGLNVAAPAGTVENTSGIVVGPNGGATVTALTSSTTAVSASANVNGFSVDNCAINACGRGINFLGNATTTSTGVSFTNNLIGDQAAVLGGAVPFTTPTTTVYVKGIFVKGTNALNISGNSIKAILAYTGASPISGIELASPIGTGTITINNNTIDGVAQNGANAVNARGIWVTNAAGAYTISNNTINNIQGVFTGFSGSTYCAGIEVTTAAPSAIIELNRISKIHNRCANTLGAYGLQLSGGNAVTVRNNFISDINFVMTGGFAFDTQYDPNGIRITSGNNHKILYNSVSLFGTYFGTSNTSILSSCLSIINTTTTGIEVRNNILSNTLGGSGASSAGVCLFLPVSGSATMNLTINNNAYFTGTTAGYSAVAHAGTTYTAAPVGAPSFAGLYTAANFNPLATTPASNLRAYTSILAAGGNNDNASFASTTGAPFVSTTDLHINNTAPNAALVDGKGTAIAGITTDIDGNMRNATMPDMGADEFDLPLCAGATGGTGVPSTTSICAGQTRTFSVTGATAASGLTYQWEISTVGGGAGFANVTGGTGANTLTYTTNSALTAGTYYLRLNVTCSVGPVTAYSNEMVLTINALPTINVTPPTVAKCSADPAIPLTAGGAATYTWSPSAGLSAATGTTVNANPTNTTTYTVTGTDVNSCVNTATVTVTVDAMPSTPVITPASPSICNGGNIVLSASSVYPVAATSVLGAGASNTTISSTAVDNFPNPLAHYYGGNKHQMMIRASELTTLGMNPGAVITSIGMTVSTLTDATALQSFQIKAGHTALTAMPATIQTGLTIVRTAGPLTPVAGLNTITFTTPFTWNGTDNIIIETSFSNNDAPPAGNTSMTYGTTTFASTIIYRTDFVTGTAMNNYTGAITFGPLNSRPNITFGYGNPTPVAGANISWSPSTSLSAPTGTSVTATPPTTETYTITATNGLCTSAPSTVTVNVGAPLVCTPITTPGGIVCANTSFNLTANITGGGAPFTYTWSDGVGGVYPDAASISPNLPAGTYTFTVTVNDACGSNCSSNVVVTVNPSGGSITGPATGLTYENLTYVAGTYAPGSTFQWQSSTTMGGPYTNIASATNDTLVVTANAAGTFYIICIITSPGGCITITNEVQTVVTVAGDNVCNAIPLNSGLNGPFTNAGATIQTGEAAAPLGSCTGQTSWCAASGGISNTVWFSFVAPAGGKASIHFAPGTWDSEIAVWSAASCGDLLTGAGTLVAANDDSTGLTPYNSFIDVTCLIPGNTYYVQVDGFGTTLNNNFGLFLKTNHTNVAPVISGLPANITMSNDAGDCGAIVTWTAPTVNDADNCIPSLSSFTSDHTSGDLFPIGTTTVTYTAMDGVNTVTGSFDITVNDTELPVLMACPTDITTAVNNAGCTAIVTWTDPTTSDNCATPSLTASHTSGDVFPVGTTTVTFITTDASGNTNTCSFDVTVTTDLVASIMTTDAFCNGGNDGAANATVTGTAGPFTFDWDNDGTGDTDDTEDLNGLEAGMYSVVVTDANGCTDSLMAMVNEPAAIVGGQTLNICNGESITIGSSTYSTSGIFTDTLTAANGCDSTVITSLTVTTVNTTTSLSGFTITANATPATYQWLNCTGMTVISGQTNPSFTPAANGNYAVQVTQSGCVDTTSCVNITGIGIGEINGHAFAMYPNPTNGAFTIESTIDAKVMIMNTIGEVMMTEEIVIGKNQLNTGYIARGMYLVNIVDKNTGALLNTARLTVER